jgi:hypothetical protein
MSANMDRVGVKNSRRQRGEGYSHVTDSAATTVWPQAISPGEVNAFCNLQKALPTADLLALLQLKKSLNGLDLSPQAAAVVPAEGPSESYACLLTGATATRRGTPAHPLARLISAA